MSDDVGGEIRFERDGVRYTLMVLMESEDEGYGMHLWPATQEDIDKALLFALAEKDANEKANERVAEVQKELAKPSAARLGRRP